jgi:hypothetical protein
MRGDLRSAMSLRSVPLRRFGPPPSLSLKALGRFTMRMLLILTLLLTCACETPTTKVDRLPSATQPNESPVVVALTHFRNTPVHWEVPRSTKSRRLFILGRDYEEDKPLIYAGHFGIAMWGYFGVPEDLRRDVERRTGEEKRVAASDIPSFAHLVDLESSPRVKDEHEFAQVYPDALTSISLWPTGLSRDGNRALVVFHYGVPYPAWRAVYLLERRDNLWKIVHYAWPGSD